MTNRGTLHGVGVNPLQGKADLTMRNTLGSFIQGNYPGGQWSARIPRASFKGAVVINSPSNQNVPAALVIRDTPQGTANVGIVRNLELVTDSGGVAIWVVPNAGGPAVQGDYLSCWSNFVGGKRLAFDGQTGGGTFGPSLLTPTGNRVWFGTGIPSTSIPAAVNDLFIAEDTSLLYRCTSTGPVVWTGGAPTYNNLLGVNTVLSNTVDTVLSSVTLPLGFFQLTGNVLYEVTTALTTLFNISTGMQAGTATCVFSGPTSTSMSFPNGSPVSSFTDNSVSCFVSVTSAGTVNWTSTHVAGAANITAFASGFTGMTARRIG